jgi:hypothetical protein
MKHEFNKHEYLRERVGRREFGKAFALMGKQLSEDEVSILFEVS